MNPADGWRVRGGRGSIGLSCALLLGLLVGEANGNPLPFYQVNAESSVSLPATGNQDPRAAAMEKAKKVAFDRLLRRLFTQGDLEKNKPLLDPLAQEAKRLTERVRVVGEVQRGNKLLVTTEVTFSAKELSAALAHKGLPYNESPHPPVLFVVHTQGGSAEEMAGADQLLFEEPFGNDVFLAAGTLPNVESFFDIEGPLPGLQHFLLREPGAVAGVVEPGRQLHALLPQVGEGSRPIVGELAYTQEVRDGH